MALARAYRYLVGSQKLRLRDALRKAGQDFDFQMDFSWDAMTELPVQAKGDLGCGWRSRPVSFSHRGSRKRSGPSEPPGNPSGLGTGNFASREHGIRAIESLGSGCHTQELGYGGFQPSPLAV